MKIKGKKLMMGLVAVATLAMGTSSASAHTEKISTQLTAGPKANGTSITPNGWKLTPAGKQLTLGDFPMGAALSPNKKYFIVSNDGDGIQSLQVVNTATHQVVQTIPYKAPQALFLGVAFSPDGKTVYASAGGNNKIRVFSFDKGKLSKETSIDMNTNHTNKNFFPSGLSVSPSGKNLFVANQQDDSVSKIDLTTGTIMETTHVGHNPYMALVSKNGSKVYVTNWGASTVTVLDATTMELDKTIQVGLHPSAMTQNPVTGDIYVADTGSDQISVINPKADKVTGTVSVSPYKGAPAGTQPNALTVSPNGKTLYVANAGNNDVSVINLKNLKVEGLVPTAWYPTGVYLNDKGKQLMVLNAKGLGAGPNADGEYIANMMKGTMSFIVTPTKGHLKKDTQQVKENNKINHVEGSGWLRHGGNSSKFVPLTAKDHSPIKHVIYVIKENQTYDQVLGDLKKGNGDPNLTKFGWNITPNTHNLSNNFVTLDNFYADCEVSAQGHNWATAGMSNTYVEKNWLATYSGRNHGYDYEGGNPATRPQSGYLWDAAKRAGVSFRDYGEFYAYHKLYPADPGIGNNYSPNFAGFNLSVSDLTREQVWQNEFNQYVKNNNLPQFEMIRLPNDHGDGTAAGKPSEQAMAAQNDYALGKIVDAVSHSKYWKDTAIFVVEDEAQNGLDHVDAHRSEALVISPYTQTGKVDSTFYDQASMLHTMELILGMKPLTQFDASAMPMLHAFTNHPNYKPFNVTPASSSLLNQKNP